MTHVEGETRVKALQKGFLCWVEECPDLADLEPLQFNRIRRSAFRATFDAFRMGRVGLSGDDLGLWSAFFDWAMVPEVTDDFQIQLFARCFSVTLEAFRIGAVVSGAQEA